jgi:hypothetical protein
MGGYYSVPATPPWNWAPMPDWQNFVQEKEVWPMVHFLTPFSLYMITQSFWFSIFLVFMNEFVEAIIYIISGPTIVQGKDVTFESREDSGFSDPLMGFLGILLAFMYLRVINWKWRFSIWDYSVTRGVENVKIYYRRFNLGYFLKYAFQFALILAGYVPYNMYITAEGVYSYGIFVTPVWICLIFSIFYYWNKDDLMEIPSANQFWSGEYPIPIQDVKRQKRIRGIAWYYFYWALFIILFALSCLYPYTYFFVMVFFHVALAFIILSSILVYRHVYKVDKKQKKKMQELL